MLSAVSLSMAPSAAALLPLHDALHPVRDYRAAPRAPIVMELKRFEVCQGRYCSKKGAKKTLALFQELSAGLDDVLVEVADMSHTDHGCFDECTMGPNVRVGGAGPQTDHEGPNSQAPRATHSSSNYLSSAAAPQPKPSPHHCACLSGSIL